MSDQRTHLEELVKAGEVSLAFFVFEDKNLLQSNIFFAAPCERMGRLEDGLATPFKI